MHQEDYNEMMRLPGERVSTPQGLRSMQCPECGENYCGDGVQFCTECQYQEDGE